MTTTLTKPSPQPTPSPFPGAAPAGSPAPMPTPARLTAKHAAILQDLSAAGGVADVSGGTLLGHSLNTVAVLPHAAGHVRFFGQKAALMPQGAEALAKHNAATQPPLPPAHAGLLQTLHDAGGAASYQHLVSTGHSLNTAAHVHAAGHLRWHGTDAHLTDAGQAALNAAKTTDVPAPGGWTKSGGGCS